MNSTSDKSYLLLILFSMAFALTTSFAQAQEICNNGIDDDGDGRIDCLDQECESNASCDDFYMNYEAECQIKPTEFPTFKVRELWESDQKTAANSSVLVVGDLDNNGNSEVVVSNSQDKTITILNGVDGKTILSKVVNTSMEWQEYLAIGNVNKNNCSLIFLSTGNNIVAYDCNLNIVWETYSGSFPKAVVPFANTGPLALADFNGDGNPELYYKNEIRNSKTGEILVKGTNNVKLAAGSVAIDILENVNGVELVNGLTIYQVITNTNPWTISKVRQRNEYFPKTTFSTQNHNFTSIADYDLDGHLDIISNGSINSTTGQTSVFLWKLHENAIEDEVLIYTVPMEGAHNPAPNGTGIVNVSNIDAHQGLNCTFAVMDYLIALDESFKEKWKLKIVEKSSGNTGTTVFDFNGDGRSEIIYRDEVNLLVIQDVNDLPVPSKIADCGSQTGREYPIVADINSDGETEICVTCSFTTVKGDRIDGVVNTFASLDEQWMPSRKTWNQHAYFNVNINDDLTIPIEQQKHEIILSNTDCDTGLPNGGNRPLNTFLNQAPYLNNTGCPSFATSDLTFDDSDINVSNPICPAKDFNIGFSIKNQGNIPVNRKINISFYNGDPENGGLFLNTDTIQINNLKPDSIFYASNLSVKGSGEPFDLFLRLNDPPTYKECVDTNNIRSAKIEIGKFDLVANKLTDNVRCYGQDSSLVPNNGKAVLVWPASYNPVDYDIFWYEDSDLFNSVDNTIAPVNLASGIYWVKAIHKNFSCESNMDSVLIKDGIIDFDVIINNLAPVTKCKPHGDGMLSVDIIKKGNKVNNYLNYEIQWYEEGGTIWDDVTSVRDSAVYLDSRSYTVGVKDKLLGCYKEKTQQVADNIDYPVIVLDKIIENASCTEPTGRIDVHSTGKLSNVDLATNNVSYHWYTGSLVSSEFLIPDEFDGQLQKVVEGFYTVVATSSINGCNSSPEKYEVTGKKLSPVTNVIVVDNSACVDSLANGSINIELQGKSSDNFNLKLYNSLTSFTQDGPAQVYSFPNLISGQWILEVKHAGCTFNQQIEVKHLPGNLNSSSVVTSAIPNSMCDPTLANGSVSAVYDGKTTGYIFNWSNGISPKATPDFIGNNINGYSYLGLISADYTVQVFESATGCKAAPITAKVGEIKDLPVLSFTIAPVTNCDITKPNGSIMVEATSVKEPSGYKFDYFEGQTATTRLGGNTAANNFSVANLENKFFTFSVTNQDTKCKTTEFRQVGKSLVYPVIGKLDSIPNTNCLAPFNGSIDASAAMANPSNYTYSWFKQDWTSLTGTSSVINNLGKGYYHLIVQDKNSACKDTTAVQITEILTTPQINISIVSIQSACDPNLNNGELSAMVTDGTPSTSGFTFEWSNNSTGSALQTTPNISGSPAINNINSLAAAEYKLKVTNQSTQCSNIGYETIIENKTNKPILLDSDVASTPNTSCKSPWTGILDGSSKTGPYSFHHKQYFS